MVCRVDVCPDELLLLPGSVEHDAVPLIVDTNGHVLRAVQHASLSAKVLGKRRRSDANSGLPVPDNIRSDLPLIKNNVFSAPMLVDQLEHAASDDGSGDIQFLGYQINDKHAKDNSSSFYTPQIKVVEGLVHDANVEHGEGWLRNGLPVDPGLEDEIWPGHYNSLYVKPLLQPQPVKPLPQATSKQGLVIKTGGRGEMGAFGYNHLMVDKPKAISAPLSASSKGANVLVSNSSLLKRQPTFRFKPFVDLPARKMVPLVSASSSLLSRISTVPSASDSRPSSRLLSKLGHLAESNFVTRIAPPHSHSSTNAKPGPSHFPGSYKDDKRVSKKSRK